MKKGWGESRWKRIARFRFGNEMRESRYWGEEREKECRLCGGKLVLGTRVEEMQELDKGRRKFARGLQKSVGEEGEGEKWMRGRNGETEWREVGRKRRGTGEK